MSTRIDPLEINRQLDDLHHPDPCRRIAAIRSLCEVSKNWSGKEDAQVVAELLYLLRDESTDTYNYGGFMCDEEERSVRVCDEAARALVSRIGYANDELAVFDKARATGHPVAIGSPVLSPIQGANGVNRQTFGDRR